MRVTGLFPVEYMRLIGFKVEKGCVCFEFNKLMEVQATSLLSCTNAPGEHTVCTPVSFRLTQKVYWICSINSGLKWYTHSVS